MVRKNLVSNNFALQQLILVVTTITLFLTSCNIDPGNSGYIPTPPVIKESILPLNISMHDLNDKPIDYIDIYKISSVFKYKLTFANPNSFTVSSPSQLIDEYEIHADYNWSDAHNKLNQPGIINAKGSPYKTPNPDDCLSITELVPHSSCSFYMITEYTLNTTKESQFTFPFSYRIKQSSDPENTLTVQQCMQKINESGYYYYDCSNESKPGYVNQFIKYRLVPTPAKYIYPNGTSDGSGTGVSIDGRTGATCGYLTRNVPCKIKKVSYDNTAERLVYTVTKTFNLPNISQLEPLIGYSTYPTFNGSSVWILATNTNPNDYRLYLLNSESLSSQNIYYAGSIGINSSIFVITGLDGSYWENMGYQPTSYRYKFVPENNALVRVDSIPNLIYGVTRDGTIITADKNFNLVCARATGSGLEYTLIPMQNFVLPTSYYEFVSSWTAKETGRVQRVHDQFYGYMDLQLYTFAGESYIGQGYYFKIHADRTHCSIDHDKYANLHTLPEVYDDYVNIFSRVTSSTNSAIGFESD